MDAQNTSINSSNQYYDNPGQISVNSSIVQDNFVINQLVRPIKFIYQPPNDIDIYHIKCEEISIQLLNEISSNVSNINFNQNEYFFFYQQQNDNRIYQVIDQYHKSKKKLFYV
ncbi:15017_t:CDS:2 [Rhizophagus irregularis]|nr:15017_t:CDS:2 [Rhizophagus irregularis]